MFDPENQFSCFHFSNGFSWPLEREIPPAPSASILSSLPSRVLASVSPSLGDKLPPVLEPCPLHPLGHPLHWWTLLPLYSQSNCSVHGALSSPPLAPEVLDPLPAASRSSLLWNLSPPLAHCPSNFQKVEAVLHLHWCQPSDLGPCLTSSLKPPLLKPIAFFFFQEHFHWVRSFWILHQASFYHQSFFIQTIFHMISIGLKCKTKYIILPLKFTVMKTAVPWHSRGWLAGWHLPSSMCLCNVFYHSVQHSHLNISLSPHFGLQSSSPPGLCHQSTKSETPSRCSQYPTYFQETPNLHPGKISLLLATLMAWRQDLPFVCLISPAMGDRSTRGGYSRQIVGQLQ